MRIRLGDSILQSHAKSEFTQVGETIDVSVDLMLCDDLATARAIELYAMMGGGNPIDRDKIVVTNEHFTPPSTLDSSRIQNVIRQKAREWNLPHYHELGRSGVGPIVALDDNLVKPGMLIVGTNPITGALGGLGCYATSIGAGDMAALWKRGFIHLLTPETMTISLRGKKPETVDAVDLALAVLAGITETVGFQSYEFTGEGTLDLNVDERMEISYLIMENGASSAIIPPSSSLYQQMNLPVNPDHMHDQEQLDFMSDYEIDLTSVKPMVAPSTEGRILIPVDELNKPEIDLVVIGGGLSGTYQNLKEIDSIISGKNLSRSVRMVVYPASSSVYKQAIKDGIIERFVNAGILVCAPGRGIEGYGNHGISTHGERIMINGSLNHEGIIGDINTIVYLAGTKTCAASAIAGKVITASELN